MQMFPVELTNPAKVIEPVELTESPSIPIKSRTRDRIIGIRVN